MAIKQPLVEMGRIAAEKLLGFINGKKEGPVKINLRSELVKVGGKK